MSADLSRFVLFERHGYLDLDDIVRVYDPVHGGTPHGDKIAIQFSSVDVGAITVAGDEKDAVMAYISEASNPSTELIQLSIIKTQLEEILNVLKER